ncbi:hypothetical protein N8I74_00100 [Chitiniphilus purpureus]|uniref:Chitin-binding type-3 domain-containing protein n=1 Tax=Chitiniphilus purpureus TaxID=2981137 RepID=A0ABY6DN65_9NEIS|nr:carbohydrate-binding protein [Chitiniphilus sp. CD1]UXY15452.1 hypothetical protein N8I74_00100 [Chitiniphilus sp. CD1]
MNLKLLGALFLGFAATAAATCVPPPPDPFYTGYHARLPLRTPEDAKLPLRRPLTDSGRDYSCPMPFEIRVAYRLYSYQPRAIVHALLDEQIAAAGWAVPDSLSAPPWDAGKIYQKGDRASSSGLVYEAQWWTQGQQPGPLHGPWTVVWPDGIARWSATRAYQADDRAIFDDAVWQARWWTQGEAPDDTLQGAWIRTADPVPPPASLPSRYSARLQWQGTNLEVSLQSIAGGTTAIPAYVEVREQGQVLGRLTRFEVPSECSANTCRPAEYWRTQGTFARVNPDPQAWISIWACNSPDLCRPAEATHPTFGETTIGNPSQPMPYEGGAALLH